MPGPTTRCCELAFPSDEKVRDLKEASLVR